MLHILGNTIFVMKTTHRGMRSFMNVSNHKSVENFGKNLIQHFECVKHNWFLKNMPKCAKFDKYTKPKIFMSTTSKKHARWQHCYSANNAW